MKSNQQCFCIQENEYNRIKQFLNEQLQLAENLANNESHGINFLGYKAGFNVVKIKAIEKRLQAFAPCENRAKLITKYNSLVACVHERHSKTVEYLNFLSNEPTVQTNNNTAYLHPTSKVNF